MHILAATSNQNKLIEFQNILGPLGLSVRGASEVAKIPPIAETGKTFEENAVIKAIRVGAVTQQLVFSDDSGLEVFALAGEPGVRSARFGGCDLSDRQRMELVLKRLSGFSDRSARFVCVVAIADKSGIIGTAEGEVRGTIGAKPMGASGFGYDPIFVPEGHTETFAEMSTQTKDKLSHRAMAINVAFRKGLFAAS